MALYRTASLPLAQLVGPLKKGMEEQPKPLIPRQESMEKHPNDPNTKMTHDDTRTIGEHVLVYVVYIYIHVVICFSNFKSSRMNMCCICTLNGSMSMSNNDKALHGGACVLQFGISILLCIV